MDKRTFSVTIASISVMSSEKLEELMVIVSEGAEVAFEEGDQKLLEMWERISREVHEEMARRKEQEK